MEGFTVFLFLYINICFIISGGGMHVNTSSRSLLFLSALAVDTVMFSTKYFISFLHNFTFAQVASYTL